MMPPGTSGRTRWVMEDRPDNRRYLPERFWGNDDRFRRSI